MTCTRCGQDRPTIEVRVDYGRDFSREWWCAECRQPPDDFREDYATGKISLEEFEDLVEDWLKMEYEVH